MKTRGIAVVAALGFVVLGRTLPARAFCLTHGCNDRTQKCEYVKNCSITGPVLHWSSSCVSFDVQRDGSDLRGIGYGDAHATIVTAFKQWLSADCGGGVQPSIEISDYGPVECRRPEYNQDAPNANVFMFRDDHWPYDNAVDTLALTTLVFNADTGEIYDADVEFNTAQGPLAVGEVGPDDVDFASVATHEIGHFLGLSHSDSLGATMGPSYDKGQTSMASLEHDDVEGICAALPATRQTTGDSCEPRHGFSAQCVLPKTQCSMTPGRPSLSVSLGLGLLGLSATLLRRRLRPSGQPRAKGPGPGRGPGSVS